MFKHWGAYGAILGGVTLAVGHVWSSMDETATGAGWLLLVAHLAILYALVGICERLRTSRVGSTGSAIALAGNALVLTTVVVDVGVLDGTVPAGLPETGTLGLLMAVGGLALVAGLLLVGIGVFSDALLSSGAGALLAVGAILAFVGAEFAPAIVLTIGATAAAAGLTWVGYQMRDEAETLERAGVSA